MVVWDMWIVLLGAPGWSGDVGPDPNGSDAKKRPNRRP